MRHIYDGVTTLTLKQAKDYTETWRVWKKGNMVISRIDDSECVSIEAIDSGTAVAIGRDQLEFIRDHINDMIDEVTR